MALEFGRRCWRRGGKRKVIQTGSRIGQRASVAKKKSAPFCGHNGRRVWRRLLLNLGPQTSHYGYNPSLGLGLVLAQINSSPVIAMFRRFQRPRPVVSGHRSYFSATRERPAIAASRTSRPSERHSSSYPMTAFILNPEPSPFVPAALRLNKHSLSTCRVFGLFSLILPATKRRSSKPGVI